MPFFGSMPRLKTQHATKREAGLKTVAPKKQGSSLPYARLPEAPQKSFLYFHQ